MAIEGFVENNGGAATGVVRTRPRVAGSANIEDKSAKPDQPAQPSNPPLSKYKRSAFANPLSNYRSYNYIFTLAALKRESLQNPESYRTSDNSLHVIAKSGGKGSAGFGLTTDAQLREKVIFDEAENEQRYYDTMKKNLTTIEFNKESAGRFDFYINNVNIETLMAGSEQAGMTLATNFEFEVFEPYSMTGFIEALQVAALASGYDSHMQNTLLLKMEFIGHKQDKFTSGEGEIIEDCTRYFPIIITEMAIDVSENGARYRCRAVYQNEKAFGDASKLKSNVTTSGNTVGEVLQNLMKAVNDTKKSESEAIAGNTGRQLYDEYSIEFPKVSDNGDILPNTQNDIATSQITELLKENAAYKFPPPIVANTATTTVKLTPSENTISFSDGINIDTAITAVIRDSRYVRGMLEKASSAKKLTDFADATGMVSYFIINVEVVDKEEIDTKTNKPYQKIKYVILPYKIHYTRIPLLRTQIVDNTPLIEAAHRNYDYIYTGNNTEIKSFNLKFNYLYFQPMPQSAGDQKDRPSQADAVQANDKSKTEIGGTDRTVNQNQTKGSPTTRTDPSSQKVHNGNTPNAIQPQADSYSALAKNLHEAILRNIDQVEIEMEIVGDPYYLTTAGAGNYRPKAKDNKTVGNGEAPVNLQDVVVYITFRNPKDIDPVTGEAIFDQTLALYTGLFRVTEVRSRFNDGVFTQRIKALKLDNQPEDSVQPPAASNTQGNFGSMKSVADPVQASSPVPPAPVSTLRAPTDNLALSIASGAPITGLPGTLSKFASAIGGDIAGFNVKANQLTVGSLLNQAAGAAGSALQGYSSISSAIRLAKSGLSSLSTNINSAGASILQLTNTAASAVGLANSGLSSLSTNINSAGASILQLTNTAASAGISNAANLAQTALAMGSLPITAVGTNAINKLTSLGSDAANLMSGVGSKLEALKGTAYSLSTQLGVDINKLSGLGPELQNKIAKEIEDAASIIPNDVDINQAIQNGLIIGNISKNSLANIPSTQPKAYAPYPAISLNDFKAILDRGGNLANIPGASTFPGVDNLVAEIRGRLPTATGLDAASVANKFSTVQAALGAVIGQARSREGSLANLNSLIPSGLPNNQTAVSSIVNKFGSVSAKANSPLDILMKTL